MSERIPVILDTDMGIDDAFALALIAGSSLLELLGITTVFGNAPAADCTRNALKMCELLQLDVPVATGAEKALLYPRRNYMDPGMVRYHGLDGLGDRGLLLPDPKKRADRRSAVEVMAELVRTSPQKVVLLPVGPLTNVAVFLLTYPELKGKIDGIAMMGGAVYGGNALPEAETNVAADPEAARVVFQSGVRVVMCGLDVGRKAYLTNDDLEMIRLVGGTPGAFFQEMAKPFADLHRYLGQPQGPSIYDAVPVAWLLEPDMVELRPARVTVDLDGKYTLGCTATDFRMKDCRPNAMVAMDLDRERFVQLFIDTFKRVGKKETWQK